MGEGNLDSTRERSDTAGRARYGGLSPLVEDMGKPKSADPYFNPPTDLGSGSSVVNSRTTTSGVDKPSVSQQPQSQPDLRPPEQKWKAPEQTTDWKAPQPFSERAGSGNNTNTSTPSEVKRTADPLEQSIGSKSKMMVQARDVQRGSTTSKAIIAGATSGLLAEPLVKGMGILTEKGSQVEGTGIGPRLVRGSSNLWGQYYDPIGINSAQIAKEEALVSKSFQSIKTTYELDKRLLEKLSNQSPLAPEETRHLVSLKEGLKIKDDARLLDVLKNRQIQLDPETLKSLNATTTGDRLTEIRALELSDDGKILTRAERGLLETRRLALANIDKLELAQQTSKTNPEWFTASGAWENAKRSFFLTAATGLLTEADHSFRDRTYGLNAPSWETTAYTIPLALSMGGGFRGKAALAGAAILGGHLVDTAVPGPSWMPESFKHFSAFDAVPLGLAFAINPKSKIAKSLLIGAAVIGGNVVESIASPSSAGDVEAEAVKNNVNDKSERSYSSFDKTVKGFTALGKKNETVLEENLGQVLVESNKNYKTMSQEEKLAAHRTTAALAQSLGEYRLEKGTRLSVTTTDRPTYILDGLNMDMGGESLAFLQMARNSVKGSRTMTEIMMDKQAFGTKVTKQETADLDKVGDKVNADIETITGKHDIVKVMDGLKAFIDRGTTSSGATLNKEIAFHKTFVTDINTKLGRNMPQLRYANGDFNPDAAMMVSKLLRDQALAKMAHAAYKLDHEEDPIGAGQLIFGTPQGRNEWLPGTQSPKGFDGALEALQLAERLSPDNPDLPELKAIANRIANQVIAKVPDQYSNYKTNPLQVKP